jgi:dynein heavy chain
MPALERILEDVMLREVHKDFRLWLTTMPTPSFPVLVLQSGVKVTKEPPQGLKANLRDSFLLEVNDDLWESVTRNGTAWRRLLFSMSFFHAVIQERRKFGALGWNIPYEWNQSDFSAAVKSLATYVSSYAQIPWGALRYLVGVINYGGRVTDFLDARCEQTLLQKFFDPTVIEGGCQHNFTNDGVYCIPNDIENLRSVTDYLANLPPYEAPELFGLHNNADITFNRNASRRQLETLLSVQPRAAGAGGSTDAKVFELSAEFLSRLPEPIDKAKAHADTYRLTADGTMTSLGTVVGQEIDVFNMINQRTKDSLVALQRAIRGEVVMDGVIEATYKAFLLGRVPASWHTGSYLSRKPLASWMEDTIARIEFLRDWNDNGVPTSFWLSGFFFPQGFLTGVLQTHSRSHKLPIDTIKFRTHVTQFATPDQISGDIPEDGVFVHGMYVEGARWNADAGALAESLPGELYTPMPVVWLQPVVAAEAPEVATTYSCPVYKTSSRAGALSTTGLSTNFVLPLDLPSGAVDPSHWILRGVALLCMLDD